MKLPKMSTILILLKLNRHDIGGCLWIQMSIYTKTIADFEETKYYIKLLLSSVKREVTHTQNLFE